MEHPWYKNYALEHPQTCAGTSTLEHPPKCAGTSTFKKIALEHRWSLFQRVLSMFHCTCQCSSVYNLWCKSDVTCVTNWCVGFPRPVSAHYEREREREREILLMMIFNLTQLTLLHRVIVFMHGIFSIPGERKSNHKIQTQFLKNKNINDRFLPPPFVNILLHSSVCVRVRVCVCSCTVQWLNHVGVYFDIFIE